MTSRSIGMGPLLLARSLCGGGGGGGPMGPKDAIGDGWRKAGGRPPTSAAVRLRAGGKTVGVTALGWPNHDHMRERCHMQYLLLSLMIPDAISSNAREQRGCTGISGVA